MKSMKQEIISNKKGIKRSSFISFMTSTNFLNPSDPFFLTKKVIIPLLILWIKIFSCNFRDSETMLLYLSQKSSRQRKIIMHRILPCHRKCFPYLQIRRTKLYITISRLRRKPKAIFTISSFYILFKLINILLGQLILPCPRLIKSFLLNFILIAQSIKSRFLHLRRIRKI